MVIIIATLIRTSSSFTLEKGTVSALAPSQCYLRPHINSSIWSATHPQYTVSSCPYSPKRREGVFSEDHIQHSA
jgi:hypothetical protein